MENNDLARLTEIAYIFGSLVERGKVENLGKDIEGMLEIYNKILDEWSNGINNQIFLNNEEEGYISSYAQRRILELYGRHIEEERDIFGYRKSDYDENGMPYNIGMHEAFENY